jgi:hypothetical protein
VSSIASSPSHLALYAIIGKLSDEQADAVTEQVLDLVRRAQHQPAEPPNPPKRKRGE